LPNNLNLWGLEPWWHLQGSRPASHGLGLFMWAWFAGLTLFERSYIDYRWKLLSGNLYTFINDPTIQVPSTIIESSEKPTKSRIFTHNLNMAVLSLYTLRAGKNNFLPGSKTWGQTFPADQRVFLC
jgi:hypothetical protein